MPVIGLPKTLEISLSNLLDDCDISSWNIKGDNDGTQIWIRFKSEDSAMDNTNITYRRAPPSQMRRNKNRASSWRDKEPDCGKFVDGNSTINNDINNSNTECAFTESAIHHDTDTDAVSAISPPSKQANNTSDFKGPATMDNTCKQQHSEEDHGHACHSRSKQYNSTNEATNTPVMHFYYNNKKMKTMCTICWKAYRNVVDKVCFCTRCPGLVCAKCIDNGKHAEHRRYIQGPTTIGTMAKW